MIILDLELSGLNPYKHSIVSIGAVDLRDRERRFYRECRVWPEAHIMEEALAVNGFTRSQITDPEKITEGRAVQEFLDWAGQATDHIIAGQNVHVDLGFIEQACARAGLNFSLGHRLMDLHSICYFHMIRAGRVIPIEKGRSSLDSDKIMEYVGLPAEPKPHQALNGAKWEAEAFSRLFFDKPLFEEFQQYKVPWW